MKINWNFLRGGAAKQKNLRGGSMDNFLNCTLIHEHNDEIMLTRQYVPMID